MSIYLLQGAIEEGLIYALVALGLFISYKILNIADMTTDGSFVLGVAISSIFTVAEHPILGLIIAIIFGSIAGLVTAFLQTKCGIPSILAGIVTMTGLYSVNLFIQKGSPNLFFPTKTTIFSLLKRLIDDRYAVLVGLILITAVLCGGLYMFFQTQLGLSVRATGDNRDMVESSSINPHFTITVGLCIANAFTALAGALLAQKDMQGDINIGNGVVVIGLAGLVLGNIFVKNGKLLQALFATVLGSVVYRIIFTVALRYTSDPGYLKIVTAMILVLVLSYPTIQNAWREKRRREKNVKDS